MMKHFSLFTGIGGNEIAAHWAGFETIAMCDFNKFSQELMAKRFPGVPMFADIHDITEQSLEEKHVDTGQLTLLTGGFPCQPFSVAGKRKGTNDNRNLWPEMLRVIRLTRPTWVVAENVRGLLSMDMPDAVEGGVPETVIGVIRQSLEEAGYESEVYVLPASAVGANHRRERVFIVAHASIQPEQEQVSYHQTEQPERDARLVNQRGDNRRSLREPAQDVAHANSAEWGPDSEGIYPGRQHDARPNGQENADGFTPGGENVAHAQHDGHPAAEGQRETGGVEQQPGRQEEPPGSVEFEGSGSQPGVYGPGPEWWSVEPNVGRVAHGVPNRVDRLKALGNAVVPQQVYPFFQAIADYENYICFNRDHQYDQIKRGVRQIYPICRPSIVSEKIE